MGADVEDDLDGHAASLKASQRNVEPARVDLPTDGLFEARQMLQRRPDPSLQHPLSFVAHEGHEDAELDYAAVSMAGDLEIVIAEQRRLLRELKALRARLAALESSRWWRLNPRALMRRFTSRQTVSAPEPMVTTESAPATSGADDLVPRFRNEVVERGRFRADMFTRHIASWEPLMRTLESREPRILEIGSFEGMSACYFLWRLPRAHVTCIDSFAGSSGIGAVDEDLTELERIFDRNIALVDASRVRKIVGDSGRVLFDLVSESEKFDLVYVDGSHLALDVLVDGALSWHLLEPGGVMIFDDYKWEFLGPGRLVRTAPGVDAFLEIVEDDSEVLSKNDQVILRKAAETAR
jgi:predicted O-methyltransferase YrrM